MYSMASGPVALLFFKTMLETQVVGYAQFRLLGKGHHTKKGKKKK